MTTHNPVLIAELKHQRFVIQRSRSGWLWIVLAAAMVVPALLASVVFSGVVLLIPFAPSILQVINDTGGTWFSILMIVNLSLYPVVTLVTLGLSANSVRREKVGNTWDSLRLTHMSNHRIVRGKWLASLRAMWFDHLMATIVRIGWVSLILLSGISILKIGSASAATHFIILAIITILYGFLDAALTASLGIVSAVPQAGSTIGGMSILVLRAFLIVIQFIAFVLTMILAIGDSTQLYLLLSGSIFSIYIVLISGSLRLASALTD